MRYYCSTEWIALIRQSRHRARREQDQLRFRQTFPAYRAFDRFPFPASRAFFQFPGPVPPEFNAVSAVDAAVPTRGSQDSPQAPQGKKTRSKILTIKKFHLPKSPFSRFFRPPSQYFEPNPCVTPYPRSKVVLNRQLSSCWARISRLMPPGRPCSSSLWHFCSQKGPFLGKSLKFDGFSTPLGNLATGLIPV